MKNNLKKTWHIKNKILELNPKVILILFILMIIIIYKVNLDNIYTP